MYKSMYSRKMGMNVYFMTYGESGHMYLYYSTEDYPVFGQSTRGKGVTIITTPNNFEKDCLYVYRKLLANYIPEDDMELDPVTYDD